MKNLSLVICSFLFAAAVVNKSYCQDENMKKWMDYMTPGNEQKEMAKATGDWKVQTKFWMAPGGEATVSEGTSTGEMILGGRYLVMKYKGTMMGMPFEGMSIDGYDNSMKIYNSVWVDNMGTGIMFMTGKWNESTKSIDYSGKMVDPMSGGYTDVRSVNRMNADNSMTMEMYGPGPDGKEFKSMEITMTK